MYPRRAPDERAEAIRSDAAARRLAQIASGLGAAPATERPVDPDTGPAGDADTPWRGPEPPWWADHTRVASGSRGAGAQVPAAHDPASHEPVAREHAGRSGNAAVTEPRAGLTAAQAGPLPAIPVPGRHAARRRRARPQLPLPSAPLSGRLPSLGPAHVSVIALAVALGLAVTTWWVVRDRPQQVAPVAATTGQPAAPLVGTSASPGTGPSPQAGTTTEGGPPSAAGQAGTVTVDVAGKVRRPGIVVLPQGSRVADALAQAGGTRRGVDLTSVNLARVLVDGEQVLVGAPASGGAPGAGGAGGGATSGGAADPAAPGGLVNLNLAGQTELETLPGVGPVTAQAIIAWREQNGGFTSVEELLEVDGIGEKTLARLAPQVTV